LRLSFGLGGRIVVPTCLLPSSFLHRRFYSKSSVVDVLRCYVYICTTKIGVCWLWTSNFGIDVVLLVIMFVGVLRLRLEVGNSFSFGSILWKQVRSCQTCSPVMMAQPHKLHGRLYLSKASNTGSQNRKSCIELRLHGATGMVQTWVCRSSIDVY
jgi:hypothetical protein